MAASIPAMVTPSVLEWARLEAGLSPERAAKRVRVSPDRLLAWERGETKPTLRQAQTLARLYHRALSIFFLPEKPALPPLAAEYRRLTGIEPGAESPELRLAIRIMSQRRETAIALSEELGVSYLSSELSARLTATGTLGFGVDEQIGVRNGGQSRCPKESNSRLS